MKKKLKIETRYRYLLRDAKILASMLDLAALRLEQVARRHEPSIVIATSINGVGVTASDVRELASECAHLAHKCGRRNRGGR